MPLPNYYYPTNYPAQQYQQPIVNPNQNQVYNNSSINWVQGESAAKAFPVGAGQSVLLMDSEESVMYIKSTDQSGMPLPLRVFDYTERQASGHSSPIKNNEYVSRSEFDAFREDITKTIKGIRTPRPERVGDKHEQSPV